MTKPSILLFLAIAVLVLLVIPKVTSANDHCKSNESNTEAATVDLVYIQNYRQLMNKTNLLEDFWNILQCNEALEWDNLPIYNDSTWAFLRGAYFATVGIENASFDYDQIYCDRFGGQVAI